LIGGARCSLEPQGFTKYGRVTTEKGGKVREERAVFKGGTAVDREVLTQVLLELGTHLTRTNGQEAQSTLTIKEQKKRARRETGRETKGGSGRC